MTIFYWTDTELEPEVEAGDWTVGEEVPAEESSVEDEESAEEEEESADGV